MKYNVSYGWVNIWNTHASHLQIWIWKTFTVHLLWFSQSCWTLEVTNNFNKKKRKKKASSCSHPSEGVFLYPIHQWMSTPHALSDCFSPGEWCIPMQNSSPCPECQLHQAQIPMLFFHDHFSPIQSPYFPLNMSHMFLLEFDISLSLLGIGLTSLGMFIKGLRFSSVHWLLLGKPAGRETQWDSFTQRMGFFSHERPRWKTTVHNSCFGDQNKLAGKFQLIWWNEEKYT